MTIWLVVTALLGCVLGITIGYAIAVKDEPNENLYHQAQWERTAFDPSANRAILLADHRRANPAREYLTNVPADQLVRALGGDSDLLTQNIAQKSVAIVGLNRINLNVESITLDEADPFTPTMRKILTKAGYRLED